MLAVFLSAMIKVFSLLGMLSDCVLHVQVVIFHIQIHIRCHCTVAICCAQFETIFSQKPSLYNRFWATHRTPQTAASVSFAQHCELFIIAYYCVYWQLCISDSLVILASLLLTHSEQMCSYSHGSFI